MPEGHTIHRLARTLNQVFAGQRLTVSSPQGRFADGARLVDQLVLDRAEAVGKHLFLHFADYQVHIHLGLYGAFQFSSAPGSALVHAIGAPRARVGERESTAEGNQDWVTIPKETVRMRLLGRDALADLTGPTACEVLQAGEAAAVHDRLGPDPLRPAAELEQEYRRWVNNAQKTRSAIGGVLMNQALISGVGNIYRAEALFRAGIDPWQPANSLSSGILRQIWDDLVLLMNYGVRTGKIVTTQPEHRVDASSTHPVPRQESFYVYQRAGEACRICGHTVKSTVYQARNLFWCPNCQRERKRVKAFPSANTWAEGN